MKYSFRSTLLLAALASLGAVPPLAAEPTGFAGFDWGTPRTVIEHTMKTQCGFSHVYPTLNGQRALSCSGYQPMGNMGLGLVDVKLEFVDDSLQGYRVAVRRAEEAKLRAIAPQILQRASSARAGAPPSGTASHGFDTCLPGYFCLTVRAH